MLPRTVSIGPDAGPPATSNPIALDTWASGSVGWQAVVNGTVSFSIETTFDDTNSNINPVVTPTWDHNLTGISAATATTSGSLSVVPAYIRINLASGTGSVALTVIQASSVPF